MSNSVIPLYKKLGKTPLECLIELKNTCPELQNIPLTYAGRLDPMAEGLLLVLVGDKCKNKEKYLALDKVYEFQVLVGFETDTYDLLGKVKPSDEGLRTVWPSFQKNLARRSEDLSNSLSEGEEKIFKTVCEFFTGTFVQKYPAFSSKTVGGKQLFQLSKDDLLPDDLPEHSVTIKYLECTGMETISKEALHLEIIRRISLVSGDFRQKEILKLWNDAFKKSDEKEYSIVSFIAECSSGTYIRQLVADMSVKLGIPLVTYSIKRTRVGEYLL